ncbi:uncharacterized protein LOC113290683 [Papaver somniferum]|uniref:uncharacterized protein LOC113290683 n=1 Tax=Papaver somniferum TaxID=3469 RepID=UPI000E6FA2F0|nr:uncharacterized protein LOC113290683 [Papaver somniferum]
MDFPRFDGDNPQGWIQKDECYFQLHEIEEHKKVDIAAIYLEDEYYEEFESLKALMLKMNPSLSETYFIMSFLSGLKDEIGKSVSMFHPQTLSDAFSLSRLQEQNLALTAAATKLFTKSFTSPFTSTRQYPFTSFVPKPILTSPKSAPTTPKSIFTPIPKSNPQPPIPKRLSQENMEKIRAQRLCYNCDVVYRPRHFYKGKKKIYMLQMDTSESADTEEEEEIFEEANKSPGHLISTSFIDNKLTTSLRCHIEPTAAMMVTVANGDRTGHTFMEDIRIQPLGGCDIVLGADWLKTLGDVLFNFSKLSISFKHKNNKITLQGSSPKPSVSMISGAALKKFLSPTSHGLVGHFYSILTNTAPPTPEILHPLLQEFTDIFHEPTQQPPKRSLDHNIPLNPNSTPINQRAYKCPYVQKEVVENIVTETLHSSIIQPSHSPFASPILLVKKKVNSWRFCVDYRKLNNITIKENFLIPIVDELLDEIKGFKFLSKIDLRAGYHQIRVNDLDIFKTAFRTHQGHYDFKVMSFGLINAPTTFQALMNDIFQPFLRKFVLVFFDDILIYISSMEEHLEHLKIVFSLLRHHHLFTKMSKCSFGQSSLEYLGHIITPEGVCADLSKISRMLSWPLSKTIKELRGFWDSLATAENLCKGMTLLTNR